MSCVGKKDNLKQENLEPLLWNEIVWYDLTNSLDIITPKNKPQINTGHRSREGWGKIFKCRNIIVPLIVRIMQDIAFPVTLLGHETWALGRRIFRESNYPIFGLLWENSAALKKICCLQWYKEKKASCTRLIASISDSMIGTNCFRDHLSIYSLGVENDLIARINKKMCFICMCMIILLHSFRVFRVLKPKDCTPMP